MLKLQNGTDDDRLSDLVYETLVESILTGKLVPGTPVSELELSRQLKVSRTPVHDALKQLSKDGLVEQEANRRAVISGFSAEDVFDIFEMRKVLEAAAVMKAATKLDRSTLAELREAADRIAASLEKPGFAARWAECDENFHRTIAEASSSRRLAQDIARYRLLHRSFNRLSITSEVPKLALAEHYRILDALDRRDAKRASTEMVAHIHEWQAYFVRSFKKKSK